MRADSVIREADEVTRETRKHLGQRLPSIFQELGESGRTKTQEETTKKKKRRQDAMSCRELQGRGSGESQWLINNTMESFPKTRINGLQPTLKGPYQEGESTGARPVIQALVLMGEGIHL